MTESHTAHSVPPEPFRLRLQDGTIVETTVQALVRVARPLGENRGSGVWGYSVTTGDSSAAITIERLDPKWQGQSVVLLDERPEWKDD